MFRSASGPEVGEGEGAAGLHFPPATPGEQTGLADLHDSDLGGRTSELEEEEEEEAAPRTWEELQRRSG